MKKLIIYLIILCDSIYLTQIVNQYTINSKLQYVFILIYFLIISYIIFTLTFRYIFKINQDNKISKKKILISIIVSLILVGAANNILNITNQYSSTEVSIIATGSKNVNSNGSEVWITGVEIDGVKKDLFSLQSKDWEFKEGALLNHKQQPSLININFQKAKDIKISYLKHDWSGIVEINDGSIVSVIDLYDLKGSNYIYQVTSNQSKPSFLLILWNFLLSFVLFFSITYLILELFYIRKIFFSYINILLYLVLIIINNKITVDVISSIILFFVTLGCSTIFSNLISSNDLKKYFRGKLSLIIFICTTIYFAFSLVFNSVFYATGSFEITIPNICYFILVCIWIVPIQLTFLHLIELYRKKAINSEVIKPSITPYKLWILLFLIMLAIWLLYLIAFNPANMSQDSISQWRQAINLDSMNDWHPASHTLIIKWLLLHVYASPYVVAIAQIIFASAIVSSFLVLFNQYGISQKWLVFFALVFAGFPNNGVNIVTLWKDIPYTICLLWLTLYFTRLVFFGRNFISNYFHILCFIGAMCGVFLLRHNGMIPYIMSFLFFFFYAIKQRHIKLIISLLVTVGIIMIVKGPLYSAYEVTPNPKGISYVAPIHGIARVILHDGVVSNDTKYYMERIMPYNAWKDLYTTYSANSYMFSNPYDLINKSSSDSTVDIMRMYLDTFAKNPGTILFDRLLGVDLTWDIYQPEKGYNYRYSNEVIENDLHIVRRENIFTNIFSFLLKGTTYVNIIDSFMWRGGIYTVLLMLLGYYLGVLKKSKSILILIPFVGNLLSLILSMSSQDYRYVYFEFFIIWFIILAVIVKPVNKI